MKEVMQYATVAVRIPNLEGDEILETREVRVPVVIDPDSGEQMLTEEAVELIENTKARYMGLILPGDLRKLRERIGFTQKRISEVFQAGEKSWTRWESGQARPSRMVNVLLRLVYEGKVFVSDLLAQRSDQINWRENFRPQLERPVIAEIKVSYEYEHVCPSGHPPPGAYPSLFSLHLSNHYITAKP